MVESLYPVKFSLSSSKEKCLREVSGFNKMKILLVAGFPVTFCLS